MACQDESLICEYAEALVVLVTRASAGWPQALWLARHRLIAYTERLSTLVGVGSPASGNGSAQHLAEAQQTLEALGRRLREAERLDLVRPTHHLLLRQLLSALRRELHPVAGSRMALRCTPARDPANRSVGVLV